MVHLIYLHQGHMAVPSYLTALAITLSSLLDGDSYISRANPYRTSTIAGIDQCADQVVEELTELLKTRPEVTELSLVGVSLGGCILERAAQTMHHSLLWPGVRLDDRHNIQLRYFIAFASPLNGIPVGWNISTVAALLFGWYDTTLKDLTAMHNNQRETVAGVAAFQKRICLGNLKKDWRVPLSSAFPVGGSWPWSVGTQQLQQVGTDGTRCIWHAVALDLSDRWRGVHHAIVDDPRSMEAISQIIRE